MSSAHKKKAGSRGDFQPDRRGKFSKTVRGIYEENAHKDHKAAAAAAAQKLYI